MVDCSWQPEDNGCSRETADKSELDAFQGPFQPKPLHEEKPVTRDELCSSDKVGLNRKPHILFYVHFKHYLGWITLVKASLEFLRCYKESELFLLLHFSYICHSTKHTSDPTPWKEGYLKTRKLKVKLQLSKGV